MFFFSSSHIVIMLIWLCYSVVCGVHLFLSGVHHAGLSDSHARCTGSSETIATVGIPPWSRTVRAMSAFENSWVYLPFWICVYLSCALQAPWETPWLRTAVPLCHIPGRTRGCQTATHGDHRWRQYRPHNFNCGGCCSTNAPYITGQPKSHGRGQKGVSSLYYRYGRTVLFTHTVPSGANNSPFLFLSRSLSLVLK